MTTKTRTTRTRKPAEAPAPAPERAVSKGMILVLTTGRVTELDDTDGRVTIKAWDAGDELIVGQDVDVDEAIRMLNAELAEPKVDEPARSRGERR